MKSRTRYQRPVQPLPHDLHAEASILGGVLLRNHILPTLTRLDAEDFYDWKHRDVWQAMRKLHRQGTPIDAVTLEALLTSAGRLEPIGGISFLSHLALTVPTPDNVRHYAAIVREHGNARRLMLGLSEIVEAGYSDIPAEELIARTQQVLRHAEAHGDGFASSAVRIQGERDRRRGLVARELAYNVTFLDDYLRSILPRDLILIGAYTGAGKTQLVQLIARRNAEAGKRVYLMALEAEPDEIERRTKFSVIAQHAAAGRLPGRERLNYPDWYRGRCDALVAGIDEKAERWIERNLKTLHTLYRGRDFDIEDIEQHFRAIGERADLIILDHLHYVDSKDGNENRAVKNIVKRIRDVSLAIGVPVIVVAHLRKKDRVRRTLVPDLDDFHGASDITKIATTAILLSRAHDQESKHPWLAHTYMQIAKSRMGGRCPYVALLGYDLRRNDYLQRYMLGRLSFAGDAVELVDREHWPSWAIHAGKVGER